jgi:hypothetical protein
MAAVEKLGLGSERLLKNSKEVTDALWARPIKV